MLKKKVDRTLNGKSWINKHGWDITVSDDGETISASCEIIVDVIDYPNDFETKKEVNKFFNAERACIEVDNNIEMGFINIKNSRS